jgi:hypothetical protein
LLGRKEMNKNREGTNERTKERKKPGKEEVRKKRT